MGFELTILCKISDTVRTKCIAFHPRQPHLVLSTSKGVISLWNYERAKCFKTVTITDGKPIRSVCFHPTDPLIACGSDDGRVYVYDYVERRMVCVLEGHQDYVRGVKFHASRPWLLSCSDDQTVLLWDYAKQCCIATLIVANHYVMGATFATYDQEEWVVACSMDQTIRAWMLSPLLSLRTDPAPAKATPAKEPATTLSFFRWLFPASSNDGTSSAVVASGHTRGVNCLAIDETSGILLSGADDCSVRQWKRSAASGNYTQIGVLHQHTGNVTSLATSRCGQYFFSASEDATMAVHCWNHDAPVYRWHSTIGRLWCVACHPTKSILAVAGDGGFYVFDYGKTK